MKKSRRLVVKQTPQNNLFSREHFSAKIIKFKFFRIDPHKTYLIHKNVEYFESKFSPFLGEKLS
jgi:hypothetical protein